MASLVRRLVWSSSQARSGLLEKGACRPLQPCLPVCQPSRRMAQAAQVVPMEEEGDGFVVEEGEVEEMEIDKERSAAKQSQFVIPRFTQSDVQTSASEGGSSPWLLPRAHAAWVPRPAMTPFYIYLREYEEGSHLGFKSVVMLRYRTFNKLPAKIRAKYEELSLVDEQRFYEEMDVYMSRANQRSLLGKLRHEEQRTINTHIARSVGSELADLKFRSDEVDEELDTQQQLDGWALA